MPRRWPGSPPTAPGLDPLPAAVGAIGSGWWLGKNHDFHDQRGWWHGPHGRPDARDAGATAATVTIPAAASTAAAPAMAAGAQPSRPPSPLPRSPPASPTGHTRPGTDTDTQPPALVYLVKSGKAGLCNGLGESPPTLAGCTAAAAALTPPRALFDASGGDYGGYAA